MTASYSKTAFVGTSVSCCQQVTPSSLNDPNNGKDALIPLPLEIKTPKNGTPEKCVCVRTHGSWCTSISALEVRRVNGNNSMSASIVERIFSPSEPLQRGFKGLVFAGGNCCTIQEPLTAYPSLSLALSLASSPSLALSVLYLLQ